MKSFIQLHLFVYVERAIRRIKTFRLIRNEIPFFFHGSINQLWTMTNLFCNFLPPLIQKGYSEDEWIEKIGNIFITLCKTLENGRRSKRIYKIFQETPKNNATPWQMFPWNIWNILLRHLLWKGDVSWGLRRNLPKTSWKQV